MAEDLNSVFSLGYAYYTGTKGYPLDYDAALISFSEAALKGDVNSMVYIAIMYMNAEGVPRDYKKALYWLNRALSIDDSNCDVYRNLGVLYYNGFGVQKNLGTACDCYVKAVEYNSNTNGKLYFNDCFNAGLLLVNCGKLKAAFPYFEVAATKGNMADAWHNMGYLYSKRIVPGANRDTAFPFFMKAAELGNAQSMFEVGAQYQLHGKNNEARYWFEKSLANGYEPARRSLKMLNLASFFG